MKNTSSDILHRCSNRSSLNWFLRLVAIADTLATLPEKERDVIVHYSDSAALRQNLLKISQISSYKGKSSSDQRAGAPQIKEYVAKQVIESISGLNVDTTKPQRLRHEEIS